VGVNEIILKNIWRQPRPEKSCLYSCGFPSGHSVMSIGFFTLMFLDAAYRVKPSIPLDVESARVHVKSMGMVGRRNTFMGWTLREWMVADLRTWATIIPLSASHTIAQFDFVTFAFWWGVLLLPVPFSRVVLNDHFPIQVITGSFIGFVEAGVYFGLIRHYLLPRMNHRLGTRIGYVLVHDFPLPVYEVISKSFFLLAQAEDGQNMPDRDFVKSLISLHYELGWYVKQLIPKRACGCLTYDEDKVVATREMKNLQSLQAEVAGYLNDVDDDLLEGWVNSDDDDADSGADSLVGSGEDPCSCE